MIYRADLVRRTTSRNRLVSVQSRWANGPAPAAEMNDPNMRGHYPIVAVARLQGRNQLQSDLPESARNENLLNGNPFVS